MELHFEPTIKNFLSTADVYGSVALRRSNSNCNATHINSNGFDDSEFKNNIIRTFQFANFLNDER